jgi:arabinofuranosyltransferase
VLNVGERAEASTSTLWQWLVAALTWVSGVDPGRIAVGAGLALAVAGVALALDGTRRLYQAYAPAHPYLLPAGVLVLLALPPAWDFATSGLETGLSVGWIGLSWWLLVRARDGLRLRGLLAVAALYGLGPLVRPDLALVTVVFGGALLVVAWPGGRRLPLVLAVAAAVPAGYEIFRMGYYGVTVPLPAIAKEASLGFWHRGLDYLDDLITPYLLWVPLVALGVLAGYWLGRASAVRPDRGQVAVFGAPLVAAALLAGYVTRVGGDFMHGRMLLPALLVGLLPLFAVPLTRPAVPLVALMAIWAVGSAALLRVPYWHHIGERGIADERGQWVRVLGTLTRTKRRTSGAFSPAIRRCAARSPPTSRSWSTCGSRPPPDSGRTCRPAGRPRSRCSARWVPPCPATTWRSTRSASGTRSPPIWRWPVAAGRGTRSSCRSCGRWPTTAIRPRRRPPVSTRASCVRPGTR